MAILAYSRHPSYLSPFRPKYNRDYNRTTVLQPLVSLHLWLGGSDNDFGEQCRVKWCPAIGAG
jgi:hypothetical protein